MNRKKTNESGSTKLILILLTICCIGLIVLTFISDSIDGPLRQGLGTILTPFQKGINTAGTWAVNQGGVFKDVNELAKENEELQQKVSELMAENTQLVQNNDELERLRSLYELDEKYESYNMVGARVIANKSSNWFSVFTIDKGADDGIEVDMNVMAEGGLAGIVTEVGENWANVRAIIDDDSNVSAMISTTKDTCIVAGDLRLIDEGSINIVNLTCEPDTIHAGDIVITSQISERFLPGLMIGYVSELTEDSNHLTWSGTVTPVVDFKHLQEVLVITTKKEVLSESVLSKAIPAEYDLAPETEAPETNEQNNVMSPMGVLPETETGAPQEGAAVA